LKTYIRERIVFASLQRLFRVFGMACGPILPTATVDHHTAPNHNIVRR